LLKQNYSNSNPACSKLGNFTKPPIKAHLNIVLNPPSLSRTISRRDRRNAKTFYLSGKLHINDWHCLRCRCI